MSKYYIEREELDNMTPEEMKRYIRELERERNILRVRKDKPKPDHPEEWLAKHPICEPKSNGAKYIKYAVYSILFAEKYKEKENARVVLAELSPLEYEAYMKTWQYVGEALLHGRSEYIEARNQFEFL